MEVLSRLKSIKTKKLEKAQQALQRALSAIKARKKALHNAREKLSQYIQWRLNREDQLFAEAYEECLNLKGLNELRHKIGVLRGKDAELNQKILDAEHQLDLAVEHKNTCQQEVVKAEKVLEKYTTLLIEETAKKKRQQEREEEAALDEFVIARFTGAVA